MQPPRSPSGYQPQPRSYQQRRNHHGFPGRGPPPITPAAPTAERKLSGGRNDRREKGSDLPPKRNHLSPPGATGRLGWPLGAPAPGTAAGRTDELGRRAGQSCAPTAAVAGSAAFGGRPGHHHVALDRPVRAHCPAPTTAATAALEERKEGITSQFAGPCMAETTRPGLLVIAEVHARHRVRAGGANNWDLGGERSIMQCRACVDDTWLGVLHCIGS